MPQSQELCEGKNPSNLKVSEDQTALERETGTNRVVRERKHHEMNRQVSHRASPRFPPPLLSV